MFSSKSGAADPIDLIPNGVLTKAVITVREVKTSQTSGARYADLELVCIESPYENRRVFDLIMDPWDENASEGARRMGVKAITHICEALGLFNPQDEASYGRYEGGGLVDVLSDIDGATVAIRVKIEKGQGGHADKNKVAGWLTPNPNAGPDHKGWNDLAAGNYGPAARPAAPASPFSGAPASAAKAPATTTAGGSPSWLKGPQS